MGALLQNDTEMLQYQRESGSGFFLFSPSRSLCNQEKHPAFGLVSCTSQPETDSHQEQPAALVAEASILHPTITALSPVSSMKWSLCETLVGATPAHPSSQRG